MPGHGNPTHLFDGSFFESVLAVRDIPEPRHLAQPSGAAQNSASAELGTDIGSGAPDEAECPFDWDAYNLAVSERLPETALRSPEARELAPTAGAQSWLARQVPPGAVTFLISDTPAKLLWTYLQAPRQAEPLWIATKGFQRNPSALRNPVVRSRLATWLSANPQEIYPLLVAWGLRAPRPAVLDEVQPTTDADLSESALCQLFRARGPAATLAAAAFLARPKLFERVLPFLSNEAALHEFIDEPQEIESGESAETEPEAQPAEPNPWQERAAELEARMKAQSERLIELQARGDGLLARGTKQASEIEALKLAAKTAAEHAEKRIAAIELRAHADMGELRKTFERTTRKLRALERDAAEHETENRRLRKQLRHTQQLLEDERKKLAAYEASKAPAKATVRPVEAFSTPDTTPATSSRPVVVSPPTPLDEIFEWRADGRPVRVTPRALRRLIDSNDEEAAFGIMQALEALEKSDWSLHKRFLKRLGEAGEYYVRVLTRSTTRVLIDASNVARSSPNRYGKGQLKHLIAVREELRRRDCFPIIFYADASLPYFIDDPRELRQMVAHGEVVMSNAGQEADELLAREARRTGAYVVTNDRLFFNKVSPDFEPPRITFRIYDETLIVDDF